MRENNFNLTSAQRGTIAILFFYFLALCFSNEVHAQNSKEEEKAAKAAYVRAMIDAKAYVFVAQSASPLKGGMVRFTGNGYALYVMDSVIRCELPYYGRAYQAGYGSSDTGIKFVSKDFEYTATEKKKGRWNIKIKTKDLPSNRQLFITIFDNGNASLQVTSSDRQSIGFNGFVEAIKKKD